MTHEEYCRQGSSYNQLKIFNYLTLIILYLIIIHALQAIEKKKYRKLNIVIRLINTTPDNRCFNIQSIKIVSHFSLIF